MSTQGTEQHGSGGPDPGVVYQLATGYWASAALLAANDLGVFAALAEGPRGAAEAAEACGADPRAMAMLLDACCGLGFLAKTGDSYELSAASAAFLVPGRPAFLGNALRWSMDQYAAWGKLAEGVRTGRPVVAPALHLGDDPVQTRAFVMGMHERATGVARGVVPFIDVSGCRRMLDVGGGPGTYSVMLAQRSPGLTAVVQDLPGVVAIARELIEGAGLPDRVMTRGRDATGGDYGEGEFDAVLFSGVLHQMAPATILRMFAGAWRALVPGGRVIVSDMMLDATRTQPVFSTLFSLQMLLASQEGAVFSAEECAQWLGEAGFVSVESRPLPPPLPYTVVRATRPA
jgi:SAM-dependent methyltransferase